MRHLGPIKVVPISLDEPLEPLHVQERYTGESSYSRSPAERSWGRSSSRL